jgi:glycosyltransferase involved in cell wall biosynthesis
MNPRVTVLMPIYNGEIFLHEAIASVLSQSFSDFELLILDDGCVDASVDIIKSFNDDRIRYVKEGHRGLSGTLNRGLQLALGEYIARMDQDDVCMPMRLEKQVEYLDENLDVMVLGSWVELIGIGKKEYIKYPVKHDDIKAEMIFHNPIAHPTVMFRKSAFIEINLFYNECASEDYDLWMRAIQVLKIENISQVLLKYRVGVGMSTNSHEQVCQVAARNVRKQVLKNYFNLDLSSQDVLLYDKIAIKNYDNNKDFLLNSICFLEKIYEANMITGFVDVQSLRCQLAKQWLRVLRAVDFKYYCCDWRILQKAFKNIFVYKFLCAVYLIALKAVIYSL